MTWCADAAVSHTPIKVGVIGCGMIARMVHVETLRRLPGVQLAAHADPDPVCRDEISRRVPASRAYAGFETLLDSKDIQAVLICCPSSLHAPAAAGALERGKHIYLEKPLATTLAEAGTILDAWRRSGTVGMIGLNSRFHPRYQAAQQALASRQIGDLLCAHTVLTLPNHGLTAWRQQRATGGGVLLDLGGHHFDLMRFLFGQEIREAYAETRSRCTEDDVAMVHVTLMNGMPVQSLFAYGSVSEDRFEIFGRDGTLLVDRHRSLTLEISRPGGPPSRTDWLRRGWRALSGVPDWGRKVIAPTRDASYEDAMTAFVRAVQEGRPIRPDLHDGYQSLAIALMAEESAQAKRPVPSDRYALEGFSRH